ncbi:hypothetical protein L915_01402, partial [Phytophthora nicotianae]
CGQMTVKSTISQCDTSGEMLDDVAVNGESILEIRQTIWTFFSQCIKSKAMKTQRRM